MKSTPPKLLLQSGNRILLLGVLFALLGSMPSRAALPGAHSATVGGEVFLGGNYIELGLHQLGSFGTSGSIPAGFIGTSDGGSRLGMSNDADGFGVGLNLAIDYFLPGTPAETWTVGYTLSSTQYKGTNGGLISWTDIPGFSVSNTSSGTNLSATGTGTFNGVLRVDMSISFGESDPFYKTTVTLTNDGGSTLDSVRYMRSFDPDNTVYYVGGGGDYATINSIENTYAVDGKAVVKATSLAGDAYAVASGSQASVLFYSSDSRARVSTSGGLYQSDPYSAVVWDSPPAKGYSITSDQGITIAFDVGSLTAGASVAVEYYTSLDNRDFSTVIAEIEDPQTDDGDAPQPYQAAQVPVDAGTLKLGESVEAAVWLPSAQAVGDDNNDVDDEDGLTVHPNLSPFGGVPVIETGIYGVGNPLTINYYKSGGVTAVIKVWIDLNQDYDFDDAGEMVLSATNSNPAAYTLYALGLQPNLVSATFTQGYTYMRIRAVVNNTDIGPTETADTVGETEDYMVYLSDTAWTFFEFDDLHLSTFDWGDAPDPKATTAGKYPTLAINNGAVHAIGGTYMSAAAPATEIDGEGNGQPAANADGDDADGNDDENGVLQATGANTASLPVLAPGQQNATLTVKVVAHLGLAGLHAWIDFNGDGDWDDPGENITESTLGAGDPMLAAPGDNVITFNVPAGASGGTVAARFRVTSVASGSGGLLPYGPAPGVGEVEDYMVTIQIVGVPAVTEIGAVILVAGLALIAAFRMNKAKQTA